jgi:hypothetical protein
MPRIDLAPPETIEALPGSFSAPMTGQTSPGKEVTPALPVLSQYMQPNIVVAESEQDPRKAHNALTLRRNPLSSGIYGYCIISPRPY